MTGKSHRKAALVTLVAGLASAAASAGDEQGALLSPHWTPGHTNYVEWVWNTKYVWSGEGFPEGGFEATYAQVHGYLMKVESVSTNGAATLTLTFDRLAFAMRVPDAPPPYDSDQPGASGAPNPFASVFAPMLGASLTMEVDGAGKVVRVAGMEEVRRRIEAATPDAAAFQQIEDQLMDESQLFLWSQYFALYPFRTVQVDDTWEREIPSRRHRFQAEYEVDSTRKEAGRDVVLVGYEARGEPIPETEEPDDTSGFKFIPGSSEFHGFAEFDAETGRLLNAREMGSEVAGAIAPDPEGGPERKATVHVTTRQAIRMLAEAERELQKAKKRQTTQPTSQPS